MSDERHSDGPGMASAPSESVAAERGGRGHEHDHGTTHGYEHAHGTAHGHEHAHGTAQGRGPADGHAHGSGHGHGLGQGREGIERLRPTLSHHAGRGQVLFFDAFAGVAGDMTVAALIDLGVPLETVQEAVTALSLPGVSVRAPAVYAGAIGARRFEVVVAGRQPERTFSAIDELIVQSRLGPPVIALARQIFRRLGEAEAEVHRIPLDRVHFHEVGAVDAIVDIVGAAACLEYVGAEVVASPLPLGHGTVVCRHGVLPLPAPAAVLCLRDVPTYGAGIEAELVTPTGAAIVATVARRFVRWPNLALTRVGWGAGTRSLPDRPNALRLVLGQPPAFEPPSAEGGERVLLEANLDDATGEVLGHAIALLVEAGALDAWVTPIFMKKGRPAHTLSVLTISERADEHARLLLRETTTIGVRRMVVTRVERPRRLLEVMTRYGTLPVKVSEGPFGPPQIKPEFEACRAAAQQHGIPVREVIAVALAEARRQIGAADAAV